ncbi:hypothetical protein L207DRAFT_562561 [Hyaloscypha variabilis F]|uniref:Uncharacterized protein n=1 Tax=Hyaloscypha variabilis (strain UAMH 11265 / GT02V1 / F) TaxID=1149755 RepID=A0A2J6S3N2_HYAVF|nr:hypothetical protein L207DRAFT_562561 [Hyaloscypha variabilis F]
MRAKPEESFQFVFINTLDGKRANPKSTYSPAIRSYLRKRTISERRQRNAVPKFHGKRQLLQRAFSLRPAKTPGNDPGPEPASLNLDVDKAITAESLVKLDLTQHHLGDQSWMSSNSEEPRRAELSDYLLEPRKLPRREHSSRHELLTKTPAAQQAKFQPHRDYNAGGEQCASQMRQVGMYLKHPPRPQTSVRTILSAGKLDPFRSYPIDASLHEHWLIYYYTSVCCQAFPKDRETGHSRLLTKFVPMCLTDKLAFKGLLFAAERHSRGMAGLIPHISTRALRLASEICTLLNEEISKPNLVVTDAMIATVINLCGVELQDGGQHSKFICHMSGLEQMVRLRGGLNNLGSDGFLRDLVIWCKL